MTATRDMLDIWKNPPAAFRGAPFWSWNSRLDPDRLCRAIESMHQAGMGGFFMHSRYGLKTPYLSEEWFKCVGACIEQARKLGMKAYLYDEDRWPSGTAGGAVTRAHKDFGVCLLVARRPDSKGKDFEHVASFAVQVNGQHQLQSYRPLQEETPRPDEGDVFAFDIMHAPPSPWHNDGAYLDTLRPDATAEFIRITHRAYADRFQKDFGGVVPAIFMDEPNYVSAREAFADGKLASIQLPWTPALPMEFRRRRGYDIRDHLPELAFASADGGFSRARHDYYLTLTELFVENFTTQIAQWCDKHHIALTGHMLDEPTLRSQSRYIGAAMPHYEPMQWPGIDILRDTAEELSTAKQCSSVASQLGKERVLSELYGCTGWDWPLEGHKFIGDWQYACGVNFRCPHLTHYSLAGGAKRDYPASIFSHSPWWKYYSVVEDYFARLSYVLTQGKPIRDVLVIHPIQSAWGVLTGGTGVSPVQATPAGKADRRDARRTASENPTAFLNDPLQRLIRTLSGEHYDWDFGDESLLTRHASVSKGQLKVGKMSYAIVIVPPAITLRASTVALLKRFLASGGKVLFAGLQPTLVDGQAGKPIADLIASAATCSDADADVISTVESMLPRRVSVTEAGRQQRCVWTMLRSVTGGQFLFLQSHDRTGAHTVRVSVEGREPVTRWDARTGNMVRLDAQTVGKRVEFDVPLGPTGSALLSIGLSRATGVSPVEHRQDRRDACPTELDGPFDYELTEPNTLPLDYCTYRVGDGPFSPLLPSLQADAEIRKRCGLSDRIGGQQQPWYLEATGKADDRPRDHCQIRRTFEVIDLPNKCLLAIEGPENFQITVNGQAAGKSDGFWVDEDIKTIDITPHLRVGENVILLTFDYRPTMELEDVYLVGDFGVSAAATRPATASKDSVIREAANRSLVKLPRQLRLGSWIGQGLDFYGGAVQYRLSVEGPTDGRAVRLSLPGIACTAAAVHVNGKTFVLPWAPFEADITKVLRQGANEVVVEVIGGRKNILGPLHVPWEAWTGPGQFSPKNPNWIGDYYLVHHGLTAPVQVETLE